MIENFEKEKVFSQPLQFRIIKNRDFFVVVYFQDLRLQSSLRFTGPWQRELHMRKGVSFIWVMDATTPSPLLNTNFHFFSILICFI